MQNLQYYWQQLCELWPEKLALGTLFGGVAAFFQAEELLLIFLFVGVCADFVLGLYKALSRHQFSYAILKRGIIKYPAYIFYLLLVGVGNLSLGLALGIELPLLNLFTAYLILTEICSVLRHGHELGLNIPPLLHTIAQGGKKKIESEVKDKLGVDDDS